MDHSIPFPRFDVSAAQATAGQPGQLEPAPTAAPAFLPVRIADSGALILDPEQTQDAYLKRLQGLRYSKETLQKAGYVMQPLTEAELDQKKKCGRCHKCESLTPASMPPTEFHRSNGLDSCLQEGI